MTIVQKFFWTIDGVVEKGINKINFLGGHRMSRYRPLYANNFRWADLHPKISNECLSVKMKNKARKKVK
jgi:hypothetical protein